ncbi:MAG: hypothetical protein HOW73_45775 [Polyangiaceae bacterium]|nr:hypothetical protein [Polyangiaceae bacterium]
MPDSPSPAGTLLPRRAVLALFPAALGTFVLGALGCKGSPTIVVPEIPDEPLPDESPARAFVGSYRFVGGDVERAAVDRAIDTAIADMNGLVRGIARDRLVAANGVPSELAIVGGGNLLAVVVDRLPYTGRLDGIATKVKTSTGDVMDMRYQIGPIIEQVFFDSEKGRVNRFELRGTQLVMHVRVHAQVLPREVVYDLTFERVVPA